VAETLNWGFDDPAEAEGSEDQKLEVFRRVRDEIQQRVRLLINSVSKKS
jgi:arsenate reductase